MERNEPKAACPEHAAEVQDVALPDGHGVVRLEGMVVFVPGTVPGDRVRLRIAKQEKRFAYGELLEVVEPSPDRVQPGCPYFGRCGGCDLQALAYEKQLALKERHLGEVLRRIGGEDDVSGALAPIVPSVDTLAYRGKVEFSFGDASGKATVGLSERPSPLHPFFERIVPVDGCALFGQAAADVLRVAREVIGASSLSAFNPMTGKGTLKRLVVKEAKATGQLMCHLVAASSLGPLSHGLAERLASALPAVKSVYVTEGSATRLILGKASIDEELSGMTFRIYPLSFFQPNPRTAALLYNALVDGAGLRGDEHVLGLYCGSGAVEVFLSRHAARVTGIDSAPESIACARENAALNGSRNCHFIADKAERAHRRMAGKKIDLLVVDPPRRGLSGEAIAAIRAIKPTRLCYISCNPATLARDLKAMRPDYRPTRIIPFDFFPQTGHFEVLTLLEKSSRG